MKSFIVTFSEPGFEGKYVARLFIETIPQNVFYIRETLDEIRRCIPAVYMRAPPNRFDPSVVVERWETWLAL